MYAVYVCRERGGTCTYRRKERERKREKEKERGREREAGSLTSSGVCWSTIMVGLSDFMARLFGGFPNIPPPR